MDAANLNLNDEAEYKFELFCYEVFVSSSELCGGVPETHVGYTYTYRREFHTRAAVLV